MRIDKLEPRRSAAQDAVCTEVNRAFERAGSQHTERHSNISIDEARMQQIAARYGMISGADLQSSPACQPSHQPISRPTVDEPRQHCDTLGRRRTAVSLLVGIISGPAMHARRDAIRETWLRWSGRHTLGCFVLGRRGPSLAQLTALDAEATRTRDLLWLPEAVDGCSGRCSKRRLTCLRRAWGS